MNIFEELTDKENKKKWRELVRKYHPDNKETGNEKIMKKVNNAYEKGDRVFERLVAELKGEKPPTDDYDKMDNEPFGGYDDDIEGRGPIYSLLKRIQKKNNFVKELNQSKNTSDKNILESFNLVLKNGYIIIVTVSMVGDRGMGRMAKIDIRLMDGTKPIEDEGPVPIADNAMLEKRINELIEKAKKKGQPEKPGDKTVRYNLDDEIKKQKKRYGL